MEEIFTAIVVGIISVVFVLIDNALTATGR